ncbi:MAG: cytochrome c [Bacteroidota bacterium]
MKKLLLLTSICALLAACGGNNTPANNVPTLASNAENAKPNDNPSYDPNRGEGKFTHVDVAATLNAAMADAGEKVFSVKCNSCHKLTEEKLVGPGWKGVTSRHTAEWIMNFVTNTDAMINKDPKAQALLEICLVRMPNQNLSDDDARALYEFMRKNDGVK